MPCPALGFIFSVDSAVGEEKGVGNFSRVVERRASQVLGSEANCLINSHRFPSSPTIVCMTGCSLALLAVVMDVTDVGD